MTLKLNRKCMPKRLAGLWVLLLLLSGCAPGQSPPAGRARLEIFRASWSPGEGLLPWATAKGTIYLARRAAITSAQVTEARAQAGPSGEYQVALILNPEDRRRLAKLSTGHLGRPLDIMANGRVVAVPRLHSAITKGRALIRGNFSRRQAQELAAALQGR